MSYEQYLSDPTIDPHTEWVDGEVVPMPAAAVPHGLADMFLRSILNGFVASKQLGIVLGEPVQMKTGPDLPGRSPDLFFLAKRHLSRLGDQSLTGPADLVIEIVSPQSQNRDRIHKFGEYERGGVPEYWLVDPDLRTAEFYRLGRNGRYKGFQVDRDGIYHCKVVPGFWIRPEWLWQVPMPSPFEILKLLGL